MNSKNQTSRYYAYFNYFIATQRLIQNLYPNKADLVKAVISTKPFEKLQASRAFNNDRIVQLLRSSWLTQAQLFEIGEHENLVVLNSPWTMVQCYYSVYSACRAYFLARGQDVGENHSSTLRTFSNETKFSASLFPPPWGVSYSGDPKANEYVLNNAPSSIPIKLTNPLSSPYTTPPWELFGLLLRTTRDRQLNKSIKDWKKKHKKSRILRADREGLISTLSGTTILDALYRSRTRSNYQDIDSFLFGISDAGNHKKDAHNFHQATLYITDCTLLVFETLICKLTRKEWFLSEMFKFAKSSNPFLQQSILTTHQEIISNIL